MGLTTYLLLYGAGWFATAVAVVRVEAHRRPEVYYCHTRRQDYDRKRCQWAHGKGCWRSDPEASVDIKISDVLRGSAAALLWPVALLLLSVYLLASRPSKRRRMLTPAQLRQIEREAGLS